MAKWFKLLPYPLVSMFVLLWFFVATSTDDFMFVPDRALARELGGLLTRIFLLKCAFWLLFFNLALFCLQAFSRQRRRTAWIALFALAAGAPTLHWVMREMLASSYFSLFRIQCVPEELILKPVEEGGYPVGKYLVPYVENRSSGNRRYAICGLAEIRYYPAIPVLRKILYDDKEEIWLRADAYAALMTIGSEEAVTVVGNFKSDADTRESRAVIQMGEQFVVK